MFQRILGLILAALFGIPLSAGATVVTWNVSGTMTSTAGTNPIGIAAGTPFQLSLSYDTSAPITQDCGSVAPCTRRFSAASVDFAVRFGSPVIDCDGDNTNGVTPCESGAVDLVSDFGSGRFSSILLRNNVDTGGGLVDVMNFLIYEAGSCANDIPGCDTNHTLRWNFFFATSDLSVLGGRDLPSTQPPFTTFTWGVCTATKVNITGGPLAGQCDTSGQYFRVDAVDQTVPEPGTLVLLGLGLAGMGFARRRRAS